MGTWRVVNSNNMEPMLKAVGMPADKIKEKIILENFFKIK